MHTMTREEEKITYYNSLEACQFLAEHGVPDMKPYNLQRMSQETPPRILAKRRPRSLPGARRKQWFYEFSEQALLEFVERWREENG